MALKSGNQADDSAKREAALQRLVSERDHVAIRKELLCLLEEVETFFKENKKFHGFKDRNRFSKLRNKLGISVNDLAEVSGEPPGTLENVETKSRYVGIDVVRKYVNYLVRIIDSSNVVPVLPARTDLNWLVFPEKKAARGIPYDPVEAVVDYLGTVVLDLVKWCYDPSDFLVRSLRCYAGTGKTRVGVEICRSIKAKEPDPKLKLNDVWNPAEWRAGFSCADKIPSHSSPWLDHDFSRHSILIVVDESSPTSRTDVLKCLLPGVLDIPKKRIRILILGRSQRWLKRLKRDSFAAKTVNHPLFKQVHSFSEEPSLIQESNRRREFGRARNTYVDYCELRQRLPGEEEFLKAASFSEPHFGRIAILHLAALIEAEKFQLRTNESSLLDVALNREEQRWLEGLADHQVGPDLHSVVEELYWRFSSRGGVSDFAEAMTLGDQIESFKTLPPHTKKAIIEMLHECYDGPYAYIEPLSPERLNKFTAIPQRDKKMAGLIFRLPPHGGCEN